MNSLVTTKKPHFSFSYIVSHSKIFLEGYKYTLCSTNIHVLSHHLQGLTESLPANVRVTRIDTVVSDEELAP